MIIFRDKEKRRFDTPELYAFFSRLWSRCQVVFGHRNDNAFTFQGGDKQVNLMGVRGLFYVFPENREERMHSITLNKTGVFDDCMLVMRRDGSTPTLHAFSASLQYGRFCEKKDQKLSESALNGKELAMRDLKLGMHTYQFGFHKISSYKEGISLADAESYPSKRHYRALRPLADKTHAGASAFRDSNKNALQDGGEAQTAEGGHNIHSGGEKDRDSGLTYSEGCQVIKQWSHYKDFMRLLESDTSLKGTSKNELEPRPAQDGTRNIIYTLIDSSFLYPCMLPVGSDARARAISFAEDGPAFLNALKLLDAVADGIHGGCFPIGQNNCWHGGLHLPTLIGQDIYVPLPGEIVAFHLGNGGKGRASACLKLGESESTVDLGNPNFILMRHQLPDATACLALGLPYNDLKGGVQEGRERDFYSLYMHLAEHSDLSVRALSDNEFPFRWLQGAYAAGSAKAFEEARSGTVRPQASPKGTRRKKGDSEEGIFPAYKEVVEDEELRRSSQGTIDTASKGNRVMMQLGDSFRVTQDNYLVQGDALWVEIEHYYDGKNRQLLNPPRKLYTLKKHIEDRKLSTRLSEWKQQDFLEALRRGDILFAEEAFGHPVRVNVGDLLWRAGEGLGPRGTTGGFLHWSVFSEKPIFPNWEKIEDTTNDSVIEDRKVLDLVPQAPERKGKPLYAKEVWDFYRSEDPEVARKVWGLQWTAVKFQSEWAGDPSAHASHLGSMNLEEGRKLNEDAFRKSADPFLWWNQVAPKVGLPSDGKVWHYNPVTFLLALGLFTESAHLTPVPPTPEIKPDRLPDLQSLQVTGPHA